MPKTIFYKSSLSSKNVPAKVLTVGSKAFEDGLSRLQANPFIYGLAPEDSYFDFELRQLLFKTKYGRTYRAVYRIDNNVVTIYRIRGPGQAPLSADELTAR